MSCHVYVLFHIAWTFRRNQWNMFVVCGCHDCARCHVCVCCSSCAFQCNQTNMFANSIRPGQAEPSQQEGEGVP
eukprot:5228758-Pyramimonas_sp.AAC.1